jgi:hypothetical protein
MNYTSLNEAYEINDTNEYNIYDDTLNFSFYNDDINNINNINNININSNINNINNSNNNDSNNINDNKNKNKNEIVIKNNSNMIENKNENINNNTIDARKLLRDYKNLNKILNENKIFSINLDKQKEEIINYKCNIYLKHQNVMLQLCRETPEPIDTNEMNEHIINYIELFKIYVDKWINEYYIKTKNNLLEDIEKQEIKLIAYRNLFINTTKEIIPLEKVSKNICPICFENEINMCAIPCGHTCCNECVLKSIQYHRAKLTKCLSCRNTLKEYIKLYIRL